MSPDTIQLIEGCVRVIAEIAVPVILGFAFRQWFHFTGSQVSLNDQQMLTDSIIRGAARAWEDHGKGMTVAQILPDVLTYVKTMNPGLVSKIFGSAEDALRTRVESTIAAQIQVEDPKAPLQAVPTIASTIAAAQAVPGKVLTGVAP